MVHGGGVVIGDVTCEKVRMVAIVLSLLLLLVI